MQFHIIADSIWSNARDLKPSWTRLGELHVVLSVHGLKKPCYLLFNVIQDSYSLRAGVFRHYARAKQS